MRVRVKWPDGSQRQASVRTWPELYRLVGSPQAGPRRVSVEPDGDGFAVIVLPD